MNTWLRLPAVCVLVACSLSGCAAQVYSNPFNVTNNGAIGANTGPLLPRLSTYIPTGTFFTNATVSLGTTSYRCANNLSSRPGFSTAVTCSLLTWSAILALHQARSCDIVRMLRWTIEVLICAFARA